MLRIGELFRQNLLVHICSAVDLKYIFPFCHWTFLVRLSLLLLPKTYGLEYIPVVLLFLRWLLQDSAGLKCILRDIYLWYCGYGSGGKAAFTTIWYGVQSAATVCFSAIMVRATFWVYNYGTRTLFTHLLRYLATYAFASTLCVVFIGLFKLILDTENPLVSLIITNTALFNCN